jgi:glycerol-3-phosphate acyltransferase PlsY
MFSLSAAAAILAAYLLGSLSFAVLISRTMGLADPRSYGSGNPGATNVLRTGNKKAALMTLLFDALKGFVPVLLVVLFGARWGLDPSVAAFVGLAAFVGHLWPVFFRFQGGKGVATAAGALLGLNPALGGSVLLVWLLVAFATRYSSLASIAAAFCAPLVQALVWGVDASLLAVAGMSLLLVWRHEGNIRKLLAGTESKIGQKAAAPAAHAKASAHPPRHLHPHAPKTGHGRKGHRK